jgi:hypothetical protein
MANTIDAVPEYTLVLRINRFLMPLNQKLRKARGDRARSDLGEYFLLDVKRNLILETHVQVEALGRRLGGSIAGRT